MRIATLAHRIDPVTQRAYPRAHQEHPSKPGLKGLMQALDLACFRMLQWEEELAIS